MSGDLKGTTASGVEGPSRGRDGRVRYAVVGLGWIAQSAMLPGFANARENSTLAALVSDDPDKSGPLAERYGRPKVYTYDQFDACVGSGEVDAVYLAVPNHLHRTYAERAAAAGVHVLTEKPLAGSEADGRAVIAACRKAGVRLMVAYRLHLHRAFLKAIEVARSGRLGDPRVFTSLFVEPIPEGDSRLKAGDGGGPLDYIGVYCVNAARQLFAAEPEEVTAFTGGQGQGRFGQVEEHVAAVLRFPGGRLASFTCGFNSPYRAEFRLTGTAGDVALDRAYGMKGRMTGSVTVGGTSEPLVFEPDDQFGAQLVYFSGCVLDGRDPQPSGEEGLADLHILAALHDSARFGQAVKVTPVAPPARPDPARAVTLPPTAEPDLIKVKSPFSQSN